VLHFPVVLMGEAYWTPLLEWVRRSALADGMISPEDLELLTLTDDPHVAVETVLASVRADDEAPSPHAPRKADAQ
jgi:predicted Rossmann-fold nucleotide-binding protein